MQPDVELTLHLIASGLLELRDQVERSGSMSVPYPGKLQRGLDRLAIYLLRNGRAGPESTVDLLAWGRRPLQAWGLDFEVDYLRPNDCLLDGDFITVFCEDWARSDADLEASFTEERFMKRVFDRCRSAAAPETYTALRQLLIEAPVLTAFEFQQKRFEPRFEPVAELLDEAYAPVPVSSFIQDQIICCPICGNMLQFTRERQWLCENERCRATPVPQTGRTLRQKDKPVWLIRALRRFVGAPGLAEVSLAQQLAALGLTVELWPDYDAYDLRVTFPAGKVWAIDVKDWADPFLLARAAKPFKANPVWDEAFFVFPDERKLDRPNYLRFFKKHAQVLNNRVQAKFAGDLLRAAQRVLQGKS